MKIISLKTRIMFGSIFWTIGLFTVSGIFLHAVSDKMVAQKVHHLALRYWLSLVLIGSISMLIGFLQVRRGMSPINQLRSRLLTVHKGVSTKVEGSYPAEVQPLVDDLNALIEERERRVTRAIAKAGDLAHGLKTPLAVLAHEAQQVRVAGHGQLAEEIDLQIHIMRRQIDYHLAHARAGSSTSRSVAHTSIAVSVEGLARALQRLHAERDLNIDIDVSASHTFRGQRENLDEMLGNLLDNACKWARTQVRITSTKVAEEIVIVIDDDGNGIEPSMREAVMRRGIRADELAQGSGLGLAIVSDLTEIYGGSISLGESPLGGLRACLTLPVLNGQCL